MGKGLQGQHLSPREGGRLRGLQAGGASQGSGCPHQGEKEEAAGGGGARKGKRPEGSCSAGVGVRPVSWSVGESRLLGFTCTPRGCLPAPGLELPKQSLSCPATTGLRIPKKLAPLRIAGPFFDRRKRWLGEGCRQGGRQESRGLLLYSERPLPCEAGRPAAG